MLALMGCLQDELGDQYQIIDTEYYLRVPIGYNLTQVQAVKSQWAHIYAVERSAEQPNIFIWGKIPLNTPEDKTIEYYLSAYEYSSVEKISRDGFDIYIAKLEPLQLTDGEFVAQGFLVDLDDNYMIKFDVFDRPENQELAFKLLDTLMSSIEKED